MSLLSVKAVMEIPEGTRPVLVGLDLVDVMGGRTLDGRLLSYDWGKPDEDGFWTPWITVIDDGKIVVDRAEYEENKRLADRERENAMGRMP